MIRSPFPRDSRVPLKPLASGIARSAILVAIALTIGCEREAHQPMRTGISTGQNVRLRAAPDLSARVVLTIRQDEPVRVVGETTDWYRVNVRGRVGYVARQYVRINAHRSVEGVDGPPVPIHLKGFGVKSARRLLEVAASIFLKPGAAVVIAILGMWLFLRRFRKPANHVGPRYAGFVLAFALTVACVLSSVAVLTLMLDLGLNMPLQYALPAAGAMTAVAVVVVWRHWQLRQIAPNAIKSTRQAVGHAVLTEPNRA